MMFVALISTKIMVLTDFSLKTIFQCVVSHYKLIHDLHRKFEMLFYDFKRLICVLEEAHKKNNDSKKFDNLVIELSDLAVKLQEMGKCSHHRCKV